MYEVNNALSLERAGWMTEGERRGNNGGEGTKNWIKVLIFRFDRWMRVKG